MNESPPLVVLDIVGLTPSMLGENTPNLNTLVNDGFICPMEGVFPAVTCTAQSSMLTGLTPEQHGIVANGWYFHDLAEIFFWRQSNHLVGGEKVWEKLRSIDPAFSCAKMFWWYNMYSSADYSATPRPMYPADGRKIMSIYCEPPDLKDELERELGLFPMFNFWGPVAGIQSSQWIADASEYVFRTRNPRLTLVYLPHLDYNLQRLGPDNPEVAADIRAIDKVAGILIDKTRQSGAEIMVVSEYGIERADGHIDINRILRQHDYIRVRETLGWELLDCGASKAFAVADHQIAHVYVNDKSIVKPLIKLLEENPLIEHVLHGDLKKQWQLDHPRSGDIVLVAAPHHWFTYYYWLDDEKAPDFSRTVDIHRKPGYDPVELFLDPSISMIKAKIGFRILKSKLNFRTMMDVIPLDASLVKGTHGRPAGSPDHGPLVISTNKNIAGHSCKMTDIKNMIVNHFTK